MGLQAAQPPHVAQHPALTTSRRSEAARRQRAAEENFMFLSPLVTMIEKKRKTFLSSKVRIGADVSSLSVLVCSCVTD